MTAGAGTAPGGLRWHPGALPQPDRRGWTGVDGQRLESIPGPGAGPPAIRVPGGRVADWRDGGLAADLRGLGRTGEQLRVAHREATAATAALLALAGLRSLARLVPPPAAVEDPAGLVIDDEPAPLAAAEVGTPGRALDHLVARGTPPRRNGS
ncbi:hypothetical protein ACIBSV_36885 [Embleya sp. NPDC050154]|uniref:hypothetical protein n=1 Tax=Embleya sp. NPDC050154 TaxID=3363988 RepID=UPI003789D4F3